MQPCQPDIVDKRTVDWAVSELAIGRTALSVLLLKSGYPTDAARCSADRLVSAFTMRELNDPGTDPVRVQQVIAPCRP